MAGIYLVTFFQYYEHFHRGFSLVSGEVKYSALNQTDLLIS